MTDALEGLRKVLALEESKKYSNTAVVGGLDAYLERLVADNRLPPAHPVVQVLRRLPRGGYRELHPITRKRVVQELLRAAGDRPGEAASAPGKAVRAPSQRGNGASRPSAPGSASPRRGSRPVIIGALDSSVGVLPGIGRSAEGRLARLGVRTVRGLLYHLPARYHDYSEVRRISDLVLGEEQTVVGNMFAVSPTTIGRRQATEALVNDGTGTLRVIWWSGHWMAKRLRQGMKVALSGKVTQFRNRLQMEGPEVEPVSAESLNTRRLVPVYPLTEGIDQRALRNWMRLAVDVFADKLADPLPEGVRHRHDLLPLPEAIRQVHFPDSLELKDEARRRLAFEELLNVELGVVRRRREWQAAGRAPRLPMPEPVRQGFINSLPFQLTNAQKRAMDEVFADIAGDVPMSRLIEGDVGSGKTVVAAAALLAAVVNGCQGAIMAPTEILAEQHFRTFKHILKGDIGPEAIDGALGGDSQVYARLHPGYLESSIRIALVKGSLSPDRKRLALEGIKSGDVSIAVGTHALVQEGVEFARLGLAVVDEQHRFGVAQRAALREKGVSPHMLVMTATPIPRTLALTVYGDLDVTVLNEMPPGRPPVKTWRVTPQQRQQAYNFLRRKVKDEGKQGYIIFPLVEESEAVQAKAAVQEYERLSRDVFPDLRLGLLHGRMPASEKDGVMAAFRDHQIDVLVSTAVVEVGVDVPNATVILIEGADRFGLAQLHQFRGRVRRSSEQAYCFLLSDNVSPEAMERLQIMETTDNGFRLAEEDLRLRGPGEYFGTRQSGMPDLKVAQLTDVHLIEEARAEASRVLDEDPQLQRPEHAALREAVERLWERVSAEVS